MRDDICVLSGGTGTPKLLQGLTQLVQPGNLTIIANTADDVIVGGLYVCPDVDSVLYTLAGIIDEKNWYGIRGDTYSVYDDRRRKGIVDLLRLGDRDRDNVAFRTLLRSKGYTLSQAVQKQCRRLGIAQSVWPMADSKVTTRITTPGGVKEFQEFWVRDHGRDEILGIDFDGINRAVVAPQARDALEMARAVIIGPSNPITSIGPIIKTPGVAGLLERTRVVAVSPLRGGSPFSGPAGRMLRAMGYEVSPATIARLYSPFLDALIIDTRDARLANKISADYGIRVEVANTEMGTPEDKFKLAQRALAATTEGEGDG